MAIMTDKPNVPSPTGSRKAITGGRLRRPARCTLTIPPAVLDAHGFRDQAHAHRDGMCARLYSATRRGLVDTR
ncbi:hypothetical protein OOK44_36365 [Streptomyces cellulosae]|uniref:Uncharacterized protein n=1 Tax=Streptomyces althioticus TaxID=83380 RepID=A0ABZ1YG83_9ACTN|nr:hypothetical protein [Streptomyces sp.]MCX4481854.1 hypothetical protein [Streptomyces cellulosae]WTB86661.1 hypothetical protein OG837_35895 [Streptomyces cellulosae]WTB93479.1 hypothetical protein OIE99_35115 [Streptomyces cellulosae]WTC60870.1 hypothetical protein OH715_36865 [Streptomyces cellulosae]